MGFAGTSRKTLRLAKGSLIFDALRRDIYDVMVARAPRRRFAPNTGCHHPTIIDARCILGPGLDRQKHEQAMEARSRGIKKVKRVSGNAAARLGIY
jgi:hypothetical protein